MVTSLIGRYDDDMEWRFSIATHFSCLKQFTYFESLVHQTESVDNEAKKRLLFFMALTKLFNVPLGKVRWRYQHNLIDTMMQL